MKFPEKSEKERKEEGGGGERTQKEKLISKYFKTDYYKTRQKIRGYIY